MAFYIIFGILMFGVLIFIHEFGHFIAAKKCGVGIYEFAIGMGPKLFSKTGKDGVVYSLRLLPIGGFVSMHGEDNDENSDNEMTSLSKKPIWQRFIVIAAGAFMNIVLGFIIAFFIIIFGGDIYSTQIEHLVKENGGKYYAVEELDGLKTGDRIIKIGNRKINIWHDLAYELMDLPKEKVDITVIRNDKKFVIEDFEIPYTVDAKTGLVFGTADFMIPSTLSKTPLVIAKQTICQPISIIKVTWSSLINTIKGRYGTEALSGPVGVVSEMKEVGEAGGAPSLFFLMMVISINLGVMNLLPLPALDGGRLLFLIIEAIRRKPLNPKVEAAINAVGLVLLMGLMLFVTFGDIIKIIK